MPRPFRVRGRPSQRGGIVDVCGLRFGSINNERSRHRLDLRSRPAIVTTVCGSPASPVAKEEIGAPPADADEIGPLRVLGQKLESGDEAGTVGAVATGEHWRDRQKQLVKQALANELREQKRSAFRENQGVSADGEECDHVRHRKFRTFAYRDDGAGGRQAPGKALRPTVGRKDECAFP